MKERKFKEKWFKGDTVAFSVGQGYLTATPLQVAVALSAVVNGGWLVTPHVVKKIGEQELEFPKKKIDVSEKTLRIIKKALVEVVERGTARHIKIKNLKFGGKTGTAQVVSIKKLEEILGKKFEEIKEEEIPEQYRDHSWFASFAPAENPQIVVVVLVEHGGFGAKTAAPIAQKIIKFWFEMNSSLTHSITS